MTTSVVSRKEEEDALREEILLLQALERHECRESPQAFIERYVEIPGEDGRPIPFELFPFQRNTLKLMHEDQRVIVLKARQLGFTTLALAYALWVALFRQGTHVAIVSQTGDDAKFSLRKLKAMHQRIKDNPSTSFILGDAQVGEDSSSVFQLGDSWIRSHVSTGYSGRGATHHLVILDEVAYIEGAGDVVQAALPSAEHGSVVLISTGNGTSGTGEEFYNQWVAAREERSRFRWIFVPWSEHPKRDEEWEREKKLEYAAAPDRFNVEYPATEDEAFLRPNAVLVYPGEGISAAVQLGKEYDELLANGEMYEPLGGEVHFGADFGEHTHAFPIWQLEAGGLYIPPYEVVTTHAGVAEATKQILTSARRFDYPFGELRYDAAMPEAWRVFAKITAEFPNPPRGYQVSFSQYKQSTIEYLRALFLNAQAGQRRRTIAISPQNKELIRQLRALEWEDPEINKVNKSLGNDHGPDALIAGARPIAKIHRDQLGLR